MHIGMIRVVGVKRMMLNSCIVELFCIIYIKLVRPLTYVVGSVA
jgi:hypothetical protein